MNNHVIQFSELETLVAEPFAPDQVVRVVVLEMSQPVSARIPDLRQVTVGVHVRTINPHGHILACHLPVGTLQLYNGRREGDPTWQRYDAVWEQATTLQKRVLAFLQPVAQERGFVLRTAGVIDLGDLRPLAGRWSTDSDIDAHMTSPAKP